MTYLVLGIIEFGHSIDEIENSRTAIVETENTSSMNISIVEGNIHF